MRKRIPAYYADQSNWGPRDFNFLNAYLNRLFLYEADQDKTAIISQMDLSRMSRETIALIGAILKQYRKLPDMVKKYPNLQSPLLEEPLDTPLFLNEHPVNIFPAYREMNIQY